MNRRAPVLILVAQLTQPVWSQELRPIPEAADKVAATALQTFQGLVTRDNFRQMGFDKPEDVRAARLDQPLRQFLVPLDRLRNYTPGSDPAGLLTGGDSLLYPILVGSEVKSSIVLESGPSGWRVTSFGAPRFARFVATARSQGGAGAVAGDFVVRVPALNLFFLGQRSGSDLVLVPLLEDARLPLKSGARVPAKEIFEKLVPLARAHNDLPT
jgi:hypothetical protein